MSKRIYTKEQIDLLLMNPNVSSCSDRSIGFHKDFKIRAVKLYVDEGLGASEIFKMFGFDLKMIGRSKPKYCMRRWYAKYKAKGEVGLKIDDRGKHKGGGRPKTKGLTVADKIKRLEAQVAYLKAENDFLAKLRARRAESNSGRIKNIN